jgi:hypothetical protein
MGGSNCQALAIASNIDAMGYEWLYGGTVPEAKMRTIPTDGVRTRRVWKPPILTKLPIAATKSAGVQAFSSIASGAGQSSNPRPPAAPSMKLGFSFEMSFPLSVRTE